MDSSIPTALNRKYFLYIPKKSSNKTAIDWKAMAKQRRFSSIKEMFLVLYGDSSEDLLKGKMSIQRLSKYLEVSVYATRKALKACGFQILTKETAAANSIRNRSKVHYPYIELGFPDEYSMWVYFIDNKSKPSQIMQQFSKVSSVIFSNNTINIHLYQAIRLSNRLKRKRLNNKINT